VRLTDKTERKTERPLKELLDEFLKAVFYLHRDTDRRLFTRVLLGSRSETVVQSCAPAKPTPGKRRGTR